MIVKATHNAFLYGFFRVYTKLRISTSFRKVIISHPVTDRGLPVLVIANHFSWWDGFWIMYMNMKLFRRTFWFMMLEEQLRSHMFFNRMGGYPVKRGSRSMIDTIRYTVELLGDSGNMVMMFPQGQIESVHRRSISFEKGAERIIGAVEGKAQVIFAYSLVEYFSHQKPSLYMYLAEYDGPAFRVEEAFNRFIESTLAEHTKITE